MKNSPSLISAFSPKRRVSRTLAVEVLLHALKQWPESLEILAGVRVAISPRLTSSRGFTCLSFGYVRAPALSTPSSASSASSVPRRSRHMSALESPTEPCLSNGASRCAELRQFAQAIETHGIKPLEYVAHPRRAAAAAHARSTKFTISSKPAMTRSSRGVCARTVFASRLLRRVPPAVPCRPFIHSASLAVVRGRNATPSAIRFSQASGDVISGSRPRSCLNFSARLASSRASSSVILIRLAAMTAATCFSVFSLMDLASIA